jgi:peptide/nickel transport system permease protein
MKKMHRYLILKTVYTGISLLLVSALIFFLFYIMPGDPAKILVGRMGIAPGSEAKALIEYVKDFYGLDKSPLEQYLRYATHFFTGNWGISISLRPGVNVSQIIFYPLVNTLFLCGLATIISAYIGIKIGVFSAWKRGRFSEVGLTALSLSLYSVPTFFLGLNLLIILAVWIPIFPLGLTGGEGPNLVARLLDRTHHLILPLITYVLSDFAGFSMIMRSSLTDVLTEDYIITAKAKGLSQKKIHKKHAMPNAMLPTITSLATGFGWVLMGSIVIETVFSYNGIGLLVYNSILKRDYAVLMVLFFIMSSSMIIANAIADILYAYFDPRVRMSV